MLFFKKNTCQLFANDNDINSNLQWLAMKKLPALNSYKHGSLTSCLCFKFKDMKQCIKNGQLLYSFFYLQIKVDFVFRSL